MTRQTAPFPNKPTNKIAEKKRRKNHFIVGVVRSLHASGDEESEMFVSMNRHKILLSCSIILPKTGKYNLPNFQCLRNYRAFLSTWVNKRPLDSSVRLLGLHGTSPVRLEINASAPLWVQFSSGNFSRAEASPKCRRCNVLVTNRDFSYEGLLDLIWWSDLEAKIFTLSVLKKPRQQVVDHNKRGNEEQTTCNPESILIWTCL